MNLPCDAVNVLMVITCALIHVISYFIHTYKLLQPISFTYVICASIYEALCAHAVVWLVQSIYCIYVYTDVTLMQ